MFKKAACLCALFLATAPTALAQSRSLYVGNVELTLGMPCETAKKSLTGTHTVREVNTGTYSVMRHDTKTKRYSPAGSFVCERDKVSYITRDYDTSAWPDDEGFAVGRMIYEAVSGSIPVTGSDGAKRASVNLVIMSQDAVGGNLKTISMFINGRRITVSLWDGADGRSVGASVSIKSTP